MKYLIYYRVDTEERYTTDDLIVQASSWEELIPHLKSIEEWNTIISITVVEE